MGILGVSLQTFRRCYGVPLLAALMVPWMAGASPPDRAYPPPTPDQTQRALSYGERFQMQRWPPPVRYTTPPMAIPPAYMAPSPEGQPSGGYYNPYQEYCMRYPYAAYCRSAVWSVYPLPGSYGSTDVSETESTDE